MKRFALILLMIPICLSVFSQSDNLMPIRKSRLVNINNTNYVRIVDGIIISDSVIIKGFKSVKHVRNLDDIKKMGIDSKIKPIMIIEFETLDIEDKIDSILYSRSDFIKNYKYALDIQLPISVNNELLSNERKRFELSQISFNQIEGIEYLDKKDPRVNVALTPFGMINLKVNKR
ncbi:hypothetical protein [Pedobacter nyackensis]|uniref:YceI-like domain-containing protein n=1 Tax=Pedobacter nyackensis TaxID=475255 RepID=A0A1W2AKF6_9SPHI|nr:hypothetical protein [Pedobacter nyackensis]SMC61177.1 hypothetical protein SAMN04488101_101703 [Pedobacter nyackensis]